MAHETASTEEEDSISPKLLGRGFNHKKKNNLHRNFSATVGMDLDLEDDDIGRYIHRLYILSMYNLCIYMYCTLQ